MRLLPQTMSNTMLVTMLLVTNTYQIHCCMHTLQRAIIKSFFSDPITIPKIKAIMDIIENKNLGYPDYSKRTGLIWTDFWVKRKNSTLTLKECHETTKLTSSTDGHIKQQNPQTFFNYPSLIPIIQEQMLPPIFETIETNKWANIPKSIFAQLFIQRCHTSQAMDWHQDPGEDFDTMADFSLVGMLSDQNDPEHGWNGGVFKIRPGLPTEQCSPEDEPTIMHCYNQAILFNNKNNSHTVSSVTTQLPKTIRDLFVLTIYFDKIPKPITQKR